MTRPDRNRSRQIAREGEEAVVRWLVERGYRVLHRNLRVGRGEIDIVASQGGVVSLVEVKARSSQRAGEGYEAVTRAKMSQLRKLGKIFAASRPRARYRYDVASVSWNRDGQPEIRYFENAFTDTDP